MKTIVAFIITAFTFSASASNIVAKFDFGAGPGLSNKTKFYQSTINEDGEIYIEVFSKNTFNVARPAAEEVFSAKISETNLNQLKSLTASLQNAEIVTTFNDIICMLMPSDFMMSNHLYLNRNYDSETDTFDGALELVLGPQGCWVSNKVMLKNKWDNNTAKRIKTLIEILTFEYAN